MQQTIIHRIITECQKQVLEYNLIEEDRVKADGNVAVCIIDSDGNVHGKVFGDDKLKGREAYTVAWIKASQAQITGIKTGEYEKLVFTEAIDDKKFGIKRRDFIGWKGGQPVTLQDGSTIYAGFSGYRGITDLEIIIRAVAAAEAIEE